MNPKLSLRRRRLLVSAAYGLTSGLVAPASLAGVCDPPDPGRHAGCYPIRSGMPLLGGRVVIVDRGNVAAAQRGEAPAGETIAPTGPVAPAEGAAPAPNPSETTNPETPS